MYVCVCPRAITVILIQLGNHPTHIHIDAIEVHFSIKRKPKRKVVLEIDWRENHIWF